MSNDHLNRVIEKAIDDPLGAVLVSMLMVAVFAMLSIILMNAFTSPEQRQLNLYKECIEIRGSNPGECKEIVYGRDNN